MQRKQFSLDRWIRNPNLPEETNAFLPLLELSGDRRVLIENHLGVMQYTQEQIGVKMKYGSLYVCGNELMLAQLTREKMIICGRIESIRLIRRNGQ